MKETKKESENLDRVFHALADPTRRALLELLVKHGQTITELASPFKMTLAAVSKHIRVLETAGLIVRQVDGRIHRCTADLTSLKSASTFIDKYRRFWESQFDALDEYLKSQSTNKKNKDSL